MRGAVVFDLDGVLVDSTGVVERAWRRWADEAQVPAADVLAVAHGRPAHEVVARFAPQLDAREQADRLDDWELEDPAGVSVVAGACECVELAAQGPWAIVTSGGSRLARARLEAVGLPLPPVLVTADDVRFGKPHPEPYQRAGRALQIPAADCVVVEDAPAGVAAAADAGMTVLAVTTTHDAADLRAADAVFASMHDVHAHLRASAS